jgi:hypothetical protein
VYLKHLSTLEFVVYAAFLAVVIAALFRFVPGRAAPVRTTAYSDEELASHDGKLAKYFLAGGGFLVLGSLHMLVKNVPWLAEWAARAGYAGHLVRDLSNTHLIIVGGGTLIATGLTWKVLPRVVGRPLASDGLAQCAFWFTAAGLAVFYVALVGNGIAIGRLVEHGADYEAAKESMGDWYRAPVGMGAGVMGVGYWCFAAGVLVTVFQARLMRVPRPQGHLWKFFVTGAAALTVGTVQGVIQVQPANADWLYHAGHAGEWIDPISHAHINLVTGLTMLVAGAAFFLVPVAGGRAPSRRVANATFFGLLGASLTFYLVALYLGLHEGRLVVDRGLSPERAEALTPLHGPLIMVAGIAMFASFWVLLGVLVRCVRHAEWTLRAFVLAGCGALAVGTLQGPVQAVPAVNELLDRGGDPGDVIVNLHAQLNMIGGLLSILVGLALTVLADRRPVPRRAARVAVVGIAAGTGVYYAAGIGFAAAEAHAVAHGGTFASAIGRWEPWQALVSMPAAAAILAGFSTYAAVVWRLSARERRATRETLRGLPVRFTGRIPNRVRRRRPASVAAYELPMGVLGFPGVGWLFAGFPFTGTVLLLAGPAIAWAVLPIAFSPYGQGPLRGVGWELELAYLPATTLVSAGLLYRAHRRRRWTLAGRPPSGRRRGRGVAYRTRIKVALGTIALVLCTLPFVPAVAGVGSSTVHYSYQRFSKEITGVFLGTPRGPVTLFRWRDPQGAFPHDALRIHASDARSLIVRAAAVDAPAAYHLYDVDRGGEVRLGVVAAGPTALRLAPAQPLRVGRYELVSAREGMFGGRDFSYLEVVPRGAAVTPIASGGPSAPAVADAVPPIAATLVALLFTILLADSFRRRPGAQKALWAMGFLCFAVAAAAEAAAQRVGWTPALFRTYYLAGGTLTVAWLGAGSAWLQLSARARDVLLGALGVASLAAAAAVLLAPVDVALLGAATSGRPPANGALEGHAFLWAVALNTVGTAFLIGGSLWSIARRRRVVQNLWIGSGAAVVALSTGLTRAGDTSFVYLGELIGIALMFTGFRLADAPPPRAEPRAAAHRLAPRPQ